MSNRSAWYKSKQSWGEKLESEIKLYFDFPLIHYGNGYITVTVPDEFEFLFQKALRAFTLDAPHISLIQIVPGHPIKVYRLERYSEEELIRWSESYIE